MAPAVMVDCDRRRTDGMDLATRAVDSVACGPLLKLLSSLSVSFLKVRNEWSKKKTNVMCEFADLFYNNIFYL